MLSVPVVSIVCTGSRGPYSDKLHSSEINVPRTIQGWGQVVVTEESGSGDVQKLDKLQRDSYLGSD